MKFNELFYWLFINFFYFNQLFPRSIQRPQCNLSTPRREDEVPSLESMKTSSVKGETYSAVWERF